MGSLLIYLKKYRKESILAPLFKMLEATFELFVPLVIASLIDKGISGEDVPYIWKMGGLLLLLAVIGLTCSVTAQYFSAKAATGFATDLRHALFSHIESLSFTEMDTLGTSTMITRMTSDVNQVQSGVNMVLRLFLRSPFIVFGAMIMAFTIDTKAALIFVVTIPLLSIVVFGIMLISIPLYKKVQAGLDQVLLHTRENLTGARVIRAFNKEEEEISAFQDANETLTLRQQFVGKFSALMNPITYIIINCAIVVLIWTGGKQVDTGILTQGQVVALVNYMSQILVELIKLANLIITVTKAFACAGRIETIFQMESSIRNAEAFTVSNQNGLENIKEESQEETQDLPVISFHSVVFSYKDAGAEALTNIDFAVKKGETMGIIGGTGSGKSTLVNLIPRFYDASSGAVLVNGTDVKEMDLISLREKIGIVMQKAVLFKGSIRDNIRWGKEDATDEEIWEALETAQAKEFVEKKESGLDFLLEQGGKNLSGGQKQRLTIARALVRKPDVLILDDSASALDFATDAALRMAIRNMEKDMAVLIVSQRAASIMYADQILVLDDGEIAGKGSHEELLENNEIYQEIYYSQFPRKQEVTK